MTTDGPSGAGASVPTTRCHSCDEDVPAGAFCGVCGADLSTRPGVGPAWLRIRTYSPAPDQHVIRPWLTTSLFPRLPRRSRTAFWLGLIVLVVVIVALVLLRWQPPLIGISAIGLTSLFVVYLHETDAFRDQSIGTLAMTATLGIGVGIGWGFALDAIWARTYDSKLGTPMMPSETLINLVAVPVAGLLVMVLPVALVRLVRPGVRESLDGFAIGALAALCFTSAVTLVQAAPEFATGLIVNERPLESLFTVATIRGVAAPLTAAAVGGMVGATLWFRRRPGAQSARWWYSPTSPAVAFGIALLLNVGQNRIDYAWISYSEMVGLYVLVAALAVVALRLVLHATLLGEASDAIDPNEPVLCPQCDHVVPDMPFCAKCGVAANAASRSSQRSRRIERPTPAGPAPDSR